MVVVYSQEERARDRGEVWDAGGADVLVGDVEGGRAGGLS